MCVVIDLDVVCLICLTPSKNMHPIFIADADDPELQVAQKISILSELKLDQNNKTLPRKICIKCLQDLKAAWRFRKNCQAAVTILHTIVKLDCVQSANTGTRDLAGQQIKVPPGLRIKRISVDNEGKESKDIDESPILEKAATVELIITNDRDVPTYEELESNCYEATETHVLESLDEDDDNEEKQNDEFENDETLVEYLTDDMTDESSIKIDRKITDYLDQKQVKVVKLANKVEERQKSAITYLEKSYKPGTRERTRRQMLSQKEMVKSSSLVQAKTKGVVVDITNSSEETNQPEVREVKTRKRKSMSPEIKTPKICEICGNSYRYQHALKAHMRRHYNDKQFPCECCEKAFVSNVELRRHMRVHTGQKPYACQYCERRFSDFGSRIKHERTHTGERPYHCGTCGKSFAYPHVLSVHLLTHTGEKRFRCDYCTKGFTKKAYLISHVNQHHSNLKNAAAENDDGVQDSDNSQNPLKSGNVEVCVYTTEMVNEVINEVDEYDDDSYQGSGEIISHSHIVPKVEYNEETHEISS